MDTTLFLKRYPIISDQIEASELRVILHSLESVCNEGVNGDVVELGCYVGTTSLFLQRLLIATGGEKRLWVYDSFEGLPVKSPQDVSPAGSQFTAGSLSATKAQFVMQFKKAGLPLPRIKKAWFHQLQPADVPPVIAFAFLDGDYYDSIATSLRLIEARLAPGAVVIVDDYHNEALPGAARAVEEWLGAHPAVNCQVTASLAVLKMP